jgi:HTH-type transcriptional regulator/antitoxin HigA
MENMKLAKETISHWTSIAPLLTIRSELEYDRAVKLMNQLVDEVGDNYRHPLYGLLDTLGTLLHAYEEQNYPMPEVSGNEMLRFLMEEHDIKQVDLPEIGSQGVISEILSGRRELNARQIKALAERFSVSPAVFFN